MFVLFVLIHVCLSVHTMLFYFSVDATHSACLVRFVNDCPVANANSKMVLAERNNQPYLVLFALKDVKKDEELRYDYGDTRSKLSWRSDVSIYLT